MSVARSTFAIASVVAVAACDLVRTPAEGIIVRDSAGVEIVESSRPRWRAGDEWRLADTPSVSIGSVFGDDPATQFTRIIGATRLSDGRIVVADGEAAELRYFDATGVHLKTVGGKGSGPGEFTRLTRILRLSGDSILAIQGRPPRQSLFSDTGSFVRLVPVPGTGDPLPVVATAILDDGTAILAPGSRPIAMMNGTRTDSTTFYAAAPGSDSAHVLGTYPFLSLFGTGRVIGLVTFAPLGVSAAHGERFYFGFPERFEIAVHSSDGTLHRLIRRAWTPTPVEQAARDAFLEREYADARPEYRNAALFADAHPAYDDLLTDDSGSLWVREPRTDGGSNWQPEGLANWAQRWTVFGEDGAWLGDLTLPMGFDLLEAGDDYLLGVRYDENGVPFVQLYTLIKS